MEDQSTAEKIANLLGGDIEHVKNNPYLTYKLAAIGREVGVSRERARQIVRKMERADENHS